MESSIGLVFRALVMLACLAVVPLVAMYGKYAPQFASAVMDAYKSRTQANAAAGPPSSAGDAPAFGGRSGGAADSATANGGLLPNMPARWNDRGRGARPLTDWQQPAGATPASTGSGLRQATFDESAAPVGGVTQAGLLNRSPAGSPLSAGGGSQTLSTAPKSQPADSADARLLNPATQSDAASQGADSTAQFSTIERRLRELGSTYYLLEALGPTIDRYRFICHMPLAGSGKNSRTRIFEAMSAKPIDAMQEVLTQIERWRSNSQP